VACAVGALAVMGVSLWLDDIIVFIPTAETYNRKPLQNATKNCFVVGFFCKSITPMIETTRETKNSTIFAESILNTSQIVAVITHVTVTEPVRVANEAGLKNSFCDDMPPLRNVPEFTGISYVPIVPPHLVSLCVYTIILNR
jgi:hypothetical protein